MVASPETIEKVVETFRSATQANRETASREGNVVVLNADNCDDVMITADLHGNRVNYDKLVSIAALDDHPQRHLVMQEVCHGGPMYPSGAGCMSHLLLEDVAWMKSRYPHRFHFLLSNHELAELTDFPIAKSGRLLNLTFQTGLHEIYGKSAGIVRDAFSDFLASCPLAVRINERVFVCHSIPDRVDEQSFDAEVFRRPFRAADCRARGAVFSLVWGRDFRDENAAAFAKLVEAEVLINGHEPCADGFDAPNDHQIILDCCGKRACFVILSANAKLTQTQIVNCIQSL